jgi:subtilisin family serine protease
MKWAAAATGALALAGSALALVPVDDAVREALLQKRSADVFVQFKTRPAAPAELLVKMNRVERLRMIHTELVTLAKATQGELLADLKARGFSAKMMWINNSLYVKAATPELINELRQLKNALEIYADAEVARIDEPMVAGVQSVPVKGGQMAQWNIEIIDAPAVWNVTRGEGTTLANIDTGVRYTHESLVSNYRGNDNGVFDHDYNWYDPREVNFYPYDNNGHGTHTMGTSAGSEGSGIGVAPGTSWISAKGCASSSCGNADLMGSFQYLLAPTPQGQYDDPDAGDVSKAPTVINNSWGGGRGSSVYLPYIQPHVEAGNVIVFSQGNSGSACSTANSPGDLYIVIGVASTDSNDRLSSFSSRGPGLGSENFPLQKPDISAPGSSIYSAYPTNDQSYATLSGTSMASPHISGVIALMRSVNPDITIDEIRTIINESAVRALGTPNGGQTTCSGVEYTAYPNYHYGYGRVNALAAVEAARALRK